MSRSHPRRIPGQHADGIGHRCRLQRYSLDRRPEPDPTAPRRHRFLHDGRRRYRLDRQQDRHLRRPLCRRRTDGAPVYRYTPTGPREHLGNIAYRSPGGGTGVDWVVIRLNADAVLTSNGPSARVDGIGASDPVGPHCKDGAGTGVHCGSITSQNMTRFYSNAQSGGGDSGGPVLQNNTEIVGMVRGFDTALFAFEYIKFAAVLDASTPNPTLSARLRRHQ